MDFSDKNKFGLFSYHSIKNIILQPSFALFYHFSSTWTIFFVTFYKSGEASGKRVKTSLDFYFSIAFSIKN